jgi:AraC-like DNA-binding protein
MSTLPMTNRGSEIPFRSAGTSGRVDALADARVSVSSRGLGWQGLVVEAIAQRLGFADQAHLTRLFRRRFGAPPGAYRRRNR